MKIEIKNRYTKEVIFSHECKNNTVKKTVLEAIRQNCNLRESDLSGSDLSTCDLSGSNLRGSDLRGSNLIGSNGNCKEIKTVQTDIWHVCMTANVMQIGCEQHTLIEWKNFNDDEISAMESGALEFWKNWKKLLFKIHEKSFPEVYKK